MIVRNLMKTPIPFHRRARGGLVLQTGDNRVEGALTNNERALLRSLEVSKLVEILDEDPPKSETKIKAEPDLDDALDAALGPPPARPMKKRRSAAKKAPR